MTENRSSPAVIKSISTAGGEDVSVEQARTVLFKAALQPASWSTQGQAAAAVSQLPLLALHACPAGQATGGNAQFPVNGSQVFTVHRSVSWQTFGVLWQPDAGSQVSIVHRLLSSQFTGG